MFNNLAELKLIRRREHFNICEKILKTNDEELCKRVEQKFRKSHILHKGV